MFPVSVCQTLSQTGFDAPLLVLPLQFSRETNPTGRAHPGAETAATSPRHGSALRPDDHLCEILFEVMNGSLQVS